MAHHDINPSSRRRSPRSENQTKRTRSRSPRERHRTRKHHDRSSREGNPPIVLPYNAHSIPKHGLATYRALFASYLDIQKGLSIEDLDESEVRGRWKSFIGKWNRGELAEGWYDPTTFHKAQAYEAEPERPLSPDRKRRKISPEYHRDDEPVADSVDEEEEEEEDYGPKLPSSLSHGHGRATSREAGPSMPQMADLRERRELVGEDNRAAHDEAIGALRNERRADRKLQKEQLDDLVPRAEAGTRERQLEKKREKAAANKTYSQARERSPEVREADLIGGDDDMQDLKRQKKQEERKKNEREIRREEALRARTAEREERMRGMREKEEKTMVMLKELAKANFGGGRQS